MSIAAYLRTEMVLSQPVDGVRFSWQNWGWVADEVDVEPSSEPDPVYLS